MQQAGHGWGQTTLAHLLLSPLFLLLSDGQELLFLFWFLPTVLISASGRAKGAQSESFGEGLWGKCGSLEEVICAWSLSAGMQFYLEITFFPLQHSRATDHLNSPSPFLSGDRKAPAVLEMRQMLMKLWF